MGRAGAAGPGRTTGGGQPSRWITTSQAIECHEALAMPGDRPTAVALRRVERNRAACGTPGLLTEEYDITQRQVRGNAPQAFGPALLPESAQRLAEPWPVTP